MITYCSAKDSCPSFNYTKNLFRITMQQSRLDALPLLYIEADVLSKIDYEDDYEA